MSTLMVTGYNALTLKLARLLKHTVVNSTISRYDHNQVPMGFIVGNVFVRISRKGAYTFHKAVELLISDDRLVNRVSTDIIENSLKKEISDLVTLPKENVEVNSKSSANKLIQEFLNYPVEDCKIDLPVYGLQLDPARFVIDLEDVVIYSLTLNLKSELTRWLDKLGNEDIKRLNLESNSILETDPTGLPCRAKAIIRANRNDHVRIYSEGLKLVNNTLALLALFIHAIPSKDPGRRAHLLLPPVLDTINVQFVRGHEYILELDLDGKYWAGPGGSHERKGETLIMTEKRLASFRKEGLNDCMKAITSRNPNPLQKRMRRAIEYSGFGMRTPDVMLRFVLYVSGLEALLLKENERRGIVKNLSNRIAWLLGSSEEGRETLVSHTKELYRLRCDIVHGDLVDPIQVEGYLPYLHWLLFAVLKRLAKGRDRFTSVEDVAKWVANQN